MAGRAWSSQLHTRDAGAALLKCPECPSSRHMLLVCFLVPPYNLQGYHPKSAMSVTSKLTHALVPSGTLTSITNLATSLARNMDRLSLDEEHYNRQEEWRRQLPESLGEGLRQGLSRLGISLLGKGLWRPCPSSPSSAALPGMATVPFLWEWLGSS